MSRILELMTPEGTKAFIAAEAVDMLRAWEGRGGHKIVTRVFLRSGETVDVLESPLEVKAAIDPSKD